MFHSNQNNNPLNQIITVYTENSTALHTTKSSQFLRKTSTVLHTTKLSQLSQNQYTKYHVAANIVYNTNTQKNLYLIYCTMDNENIFIGDVVKSVLTVLQRLSLIA